jgi:hypothetical protein
MLVTGSRKLRIPNHEMAVRLRRYTDQRPQTDRVVTLIHGDCWGADKIAAMAAHAMNWRVVVVPAKWEKYGEKAGLIRNQMMVDMKPDLVVAFPLKDSRGTWDCMNRAKKAGIPVHVEETEG